MTTQGCTDFVSGFLRAFVSLVGSVLWAPILYMVYSWYVFGSGSGAHRKTLGEVFVDPCGEG